MTGFSLAVVEIMGSYVAKISASRIRDNVKMS
jgi:hypothetical protein